MWVGLVPELVWRGLARQGLVQGEFERPPGQGDVVMSGQDGFNGTFLYRELSEKCYHVYMFINFHIQHELQTNSSWESWCGDDWCRHPFVHVLCMLLR